MGESISLFQTTFNKALHVEARDDRLTSDAGMVLLRELMDRLGLIDWLVENLEDERDPLRVRFALGELLRTRLCMLVMGVEHQNGIVRMATDPALKLSSTDGAGASALDEARLPSQPTLSRLMALLAIPENLARLNEALVILAGRSLRAAKRGQTIPVVLDVDSLVYEVHGHQDGAAYNGQYGVTAYHPILAVLGETGDIVGVWLRPGNAGTAGHVVEFLEMVLPRVEREIGPVKLVRFDAGFPSEPLLAALEAWGTPYVARIRKYSVLDDLADWAKLPELPPPIDAPRTRFKEIGYRARSWSRARRVVFVRIDEPGELFSRSFFLVSSRSADQVPPAALLQDYRRRGCAEDAFGQWMQAVPPTLSSTNRPKRSIRGEPPVGREEGVDPFAVNQANLLLSALAYNLLVALRRPLEEVTQTPMRVETVRAQVLKVAGRVLRHGRQIVLCVARSATGLWKALWDEIATLSWRLGSAPEG